MPIPKISPEFDVGHLVKAGIDQRGHHVRAFETLNEAKKESRHRFGLLCEDDTDDEALILAQMLLACEKRARCESLACPVCARIRRTRWSEAVLKFLDAYDLEDLKFVTLINPADALPAGQLHTFNARNLIHRFRRQLERAGLQKSDTFIVGAVDGEWDAGWAVFQPHLHLITHKDNVALLKVVVRSWPKERARVRVRLFPQVIYDLPRVVTYLDKSWWPAVARTNNPRGIHPHKERRPPPEIEVEILLCLNRYQSADLRLLYGVQSRHGKLAKS